MDAKDVDVAVALVISETCRKSPGSAQVRLKRKDLMRKDQAKDLRICFSQGGERAKSSFPRKYCGTATVSESMAAEEPSLLRQLWRPDVCVCVCVCVTVAAKKTTTT